jgi:cysteine desulfurase/selenocysteine lyase
LGSKRRDNRRGIYLNNATTGYPRPKEVLSAVNSYMRSMPVNPYPTGFTMRHEDAVMICREKLADFFNIANPDNIIFTSGATESINLIIRGLELDNGHIITTVTEHNSVLRPLKRLERRGRVILSIVDCDSDGKVSAEKLEAQIQPNTRAIIINHCSNVTGQIQDLRAAAEIAGRNDIWLIVDASLSAGIVPINVAETGIDILIFSGHKYLYGLPGIGGLYLSENIYLRPLKVGGTGIQGHSLYQPNGRPTYYESGTPNFAGVISLSAGLDFIRKTGIENIRNKITRDIAAVRKAFENIRQIKVYGSRVYDPSILSFNIKGLTPDEAGYMLESSWGVIAGAGLHCSPLIHRTLGTYPKGTLRISPSFFTGEDEIGGFIQAVEHICLGKKAHALH